MRSKYRGHEIELARVDDKTLRWEVTDLKTNTVVIKERKVVGGEAMRERMDTLKKCVDFILGNTEKLKPVVRDVCKGNSWWKLRSAHGRKPIFATPDDLLAACTEYLDALAANPLYRAECKVVAGEADIVSVPVMRMGTMSDLRRFLDIGEACWRDYAFNRGEDFARVCRWAQDAVYNHKVTGAAGGLLNPVIVAREAGLRDGIDHSSADGTMSPKAGVQIAATLDVSKLSDEVLKALLDARIDNKEE